MNSGLKRAENAYCFTAFFPPRARLAVSEDEEDDGPVEAPGDRSADSDPERIPSCRWMPRSAPSVLKRACEPLRAWTPGRLPKESRFGSTTLHTR